MSAPTAVCERCGAEIPPNIRHAPSRVSWVDERQAMREGVIPSIGPRCRLLAVDSNTGMTYDEKARAERSVAAARRQRERAR
jgi:hypothetical protein